MGRPPLLQLKLKLPRTQGENDMDSVQERLGWLYETIGLNLCLYKKKENGISDIQMIGHEIFPQCFVKNCILDFELQKRGMQNPLVLMFDPGFFIGIAQITDTQFLILGPASPFPLERDSLYNGCRYIISAEIMPAFCDALISTPHFSFRKFALAMLLAVFQSGGTQISMEQIVLCNNTLQQDNLDNPLEAQMFDIRENETYHFTGSYESLLINAVETGNSDFLKELVLGPMIGRAGFMSNKALMQERYLFVVVITLVTRAAVHGGLSQEEAYSLSDIYCQKMDALKNIPDIDTLQYQMIMDFCNRVRDVLKKEKYSGVIQKCCEYINMHLHETISLDDLSRCCNLCRRSVSVRFKRETGMTVPDYINAEKIKEAKYLLNYSEYSVAEIGSLLQYNSQSYFAKVFRQHCGCTPQQYRENNQ